MGVNEHWFTKDQLKKVSEAYKKDFESPIPTQMVSNGEYIPLPQTEKQKEFAARVRDKAETLGKKHGMDRRSFLKTASGMAAAFIAMNETYGQIFQVDKAEAEDPEAAAARLAAMKGQFIFDDQTHHVRQNYQFEGVLFLRDFAAGNNPEKKPWNRDLMGKTFTLEDFNFENYLKDIFLDSDTTVSLLSSFTTDNPDNAALTNDEMVASRDLVNKLAGTRRMYCHGMVWPPYPGNLEEMQRSAEVLKIDSWKSYTVGDPLGPSDYPWKLDDEKVTYPSYQLGDKLGIRNFCCHKGLLPVDYKSFKNWDYAHVGDLGKACQDWPQMNFIIYHAALRPFFDYAELSKDFENTGNIPWIDDMAAVSKKFGVDNAYGEIGSTFASTAVTYPRICAAMMGKLIKGLGYDHVLWGSDSVWYGSPQWQLEAMRRITIPDDIAKKLDMQDVAAEFNKPMEQNRYKQSILGYNSARLYGMNLTADGKPTTDFANDGIAKIKAEYEKAGPSRDNMFYGWIRKETGQQA